MARPRKYTDEQREVIAEVYERWIKARNDRIRVTKTLKIKPCYFNELGRAGMAKKLRPATAS